MPVNTNLTKGELIWMGVLFWAIVFTALEAPFSLAFETRLQSWQIVTDLLTSLIFIADLTYHLRQKKKKSIFIKSQIKEDKLKSTLVLLVDIIACIPFDFIFWAIGLWGPGHIIKLVRMFRLIRVIKFLSIFENLNFIPRWIRIQIVFISVLVVVHILTCIWVRFNPPLDHDLYTHYIKSLYWTVTTLTTVGYGDITPTSNAARIFTMIVMFFGVGVYGLVIGNISRIFAENARYKEQTREKFNEISLFMKHYHIPERLQNSVFNYYNHLFSKRLSDNDQQIISELPHALKQELQVYMNMKLIRNLPVFKNSSQACLKAIAAALEQQHYGPGDTIIRIGEVGGEMYIIGHGVVDVILKDGNTIAQLPEGQFFGEAALLKETTRNANVRASTYCDLYKLSKEDFLEIIEKYPEVIENMQKATARRSSDRRSQQ